MNHTPKLSCEKMAANNNSDEVIIRRNRPGTKTADIYNWPDQEYTEMDSILDGKIATLTAWMGVRGEC